MIKPKSVRRNFITPERTGKNSYSLDDDKPRFYNTTTLNQSHRLGYFWSNKYQRWLWNKDYKFALKKDVSSLPSSGSTTRSEVSYYVEEFKKLAEIAYDTYNVDDGHYPTMKSKGYYPPPSSPKWRFTYVEVRDKSNRPTGDVIPLLYLQQFTGKSALEGSTKGTSIEDWLAVWGYDDVTASSESDLLNGYTNLHDIFLIIDPADNPDQLNYRPKQGHLYKPLASNQKIPSLSWWLYQQDEDNVVSDVLKGMVKETKEKYNKWGKIYFNKTSNLARSQFEQILRDELQEKKKARIVDLARASFRPWYENVWLPAVESGNQEQIEQAAETEIMPAVQDVDATINTTKSAEDYNKEYGEPNMTPFYILGGVGALTAIYIGYLVYKKKQAEKEVVDV